MKGNGRFAAAVFDMDGLLIDSERPIRDAFLLACEAEGVLFNKDDYSRVIGRNRSDSDRILRELIGDEERYRAIVQHTLAAIDALQAAGGFPLKPGAHDLLAALSHAGVPLAVASSSQLAHVTSRLRVTGVHDFFQSLSGGDEVQRGKPHPDLYLLAAQRLGQPVEHCVVFEDSHNGARAALAAGMAVVVVPDLQEPVAHIRQSSLAVLDSLAQVNENLPGWFGLNGMPRSD